MSLGRASAVCVVSLFLVASTTAQPAGPAPGPGGGLAPPPGPAPRGQGNARVGVGFAGPQQRQKQLEAIKDHIEADDDAWKALSPKVEKVLAARHNTSTGAGMNWTSSNRGPLVVQASAATPDTAAGKAMQQVRDAAADKEAPDQELLRKMAAVREARQKARAEYEAAQKELTDALTPRQQAVLMTLGVVE